MTIEEMNERFNKILTQSDQAERSTSLNEVREEVAAMYRKIEDLEASSQALKEKNETLTEANSKLFMKIGVEREKPKATEKEELDLSNIL